MMKVEKEKKTKREKCSINPLTGTPIYTSYVMYMTPCVYTLL